MNTQEDIGFVLDTKPYRESSLLVRFLGKGEGYISLIARSSKKPGDSKAALLQPFNLVRLQFSIHEGKSLGNLVTVEQAVAWKSPRQSLDTYALATWWFEILKNTSQARVGTSKVYECTYEFLSGQEERPGLTLDVLARIAELCHALGYGLTWQACSVCGRQFTQYVVFSIKSGLVCRDCNMAGKEGLTLKPSEGRVVEQLNGIEQDRGECVNDLLDLLTLVNRFLVYHLETPLQSFEFVMCNVGR